MNKQVFSALMSLVIFTGSAKAATTTVHAETRSGADGGVFSVAQTSTANRKLPTGGYEQYLGGNIRFRFADSPIRYNILDNDNNGIDAGDQIELNMNLDIANDEGDVIGSTLFDGMLNVGHGVTSQTDWSLGSDENGIAFEVNFTHDSDDGYHHAGDMILGVVHFQPAAFTTTFNGLRRNDDGSLQFFLLGEARGEDGILNATYLHADQESITSNYRIGFNLSAISVTEQAQVVAIPTPAVMPMGLGLLGFMGMKRRRR